MTKENETTNDAVTLAEAKCAELQARLERARETVSANLARAHELSFDAEARDDDAARRLMTKLLGDADKLDEDVKHRLEPAVAEAKRRVKAAKDAAAQEAQRVKAAEAHALAERLEELGAAMDAGLMAALEARGTALAILERLTQIGAGSPLVDSAKVLVRRQAEDRLRLAGFISEKPELLLPLQRRSYRDLFADWGNKTASRSVKRLDALERGRAA